MTGEDDADDLLLLPNTSIQTKSLLHSLEQTKDIGLYVNTRKTEFKCFKQDGAISTLNGNSQKLFDHLTYLGSNISFTESDINICMGKTWTAIYSMSIIWKYDLSNEIKRGFFQAIAVSLLLCGCTIWTLTKFLEKKLDGNFTRKLRTILNKSCKQYHTKLELYSHLPPIPQIIQGRRRRHTWLCWRVRLNS